MCVWIIIFLVCTCTVTGFLCEDQCETIPASTSIATPGGMYIIWKVSVSYQLFFFSLDSGSTTISSSTSPSPDQLILSSTVPPQSIPNSNPNSGTLANSTTLSSRVENFDDDATSILSGGPCALIAVNGLAPSREFAFIDCSEVYLAGKKASGIYEIW